MKINILKFVRSSLLLLYVFYYSQGALYPTGTLVAKIALFLILLISGIFFFKTLLLKNSRDQFLIAWTLLLFLNLFGFLLSANFGNSYHTGMFRSILIFLLPFYPFYYLARRNQLKVNHLILFLIIMLPVMILQFFSVEALVISERTSNNPDVVNNVAYSFVALMPFVFLIKKRLLSSGLMVVIMFFIIQSSKRGAIIAGMIGLVLYLYYQLVTVEKRYRFSGYLMGLTGILILFFFSYKTFIGNEFLIDRFTAMAEGHTSGRDIIFLKIINSWYNSDNIWNLIFGFGFAGSLQMSGGKFAHNDWLELLSNFGLVGVIVYLLLFYAAIKSGLKPGLERDKRILLFTITLIWFFTTLVSMSYTSLSGYTQGILLAYLIGNRGNNLN